MDDRHMQFLILVAEICVSAHRAGITVTLALLDGTNASGVPTRVETGTGPDELDDTGFTRSIDLAGRTVPLLDVLNCTIDCP